MRNRKIKLALAQLNIDWENKASNQKKCQKMMEEATKRETDVIIFPEMTLTGFSMNVPKIGEREKNSETINFFSNLAKKYSIAIVFGAVFKNKKGKNMAMMVDKNGKVLSRYQKIHPFSYARENKYYQGGKKISFLRYCNFNIALLICYDLRFVGLAASLVKYQPDLVIVIANWPKPRIRHWNSLLKARALDLQCYVVGVNRLGEGNGLKYNGQSTVISPEGKTLLDLKEKKLGIIELDKGKLEIYRQKFPFLLDSRNKFYSTL